MTNDDYQVSFSEDEVARGSATYNYESGRGVAAEMPGISVFYRDEAGDIFHTYSAYERGLDMLNVAYHYLDLVPKGRDEGAGNGTSWVRRRDEYDAPSSSIAAMQAMT